MPHTGKLAIGTAVITIAAGVSRAEPAPDPAPRDATAADAAGAPRPGEESGRIDAEESDSTARRVARGALVVPRALFEIVSAPVRGTFWALERYHLEERVRRVFFNDAETFGLYPTLSFESGFGVNVGARLVAVGEQKQHLQLTASTGGRYRERISGGGVVVPSKRSGSSCAASTRAGPRSGSSGSVTATSAMTCRRNHSIRSRPRAHWKRAIASG
jgi:hypothetical protein